MREKTKKYLKRIFPFLKNKKNILFEMNGIVLVKSQEKNFYFHRMLCEEIKEFCKSYENIDIDKVVLLSSFDSDIFKEDKKVDNILAKNDSYFVVFEENGLVIASVFIGDYLEIK